MQGDFSDAVRKRVDHSDIFLLMHVTLGQFSGKAAAPLVGGRVVSRLPDIILLRLIWIGP